MYADFSTTFSNPGNSRARPAALNFIAVNTSSTAWFWNKANNWAPTEPPPTKNPVTPDPTVLPKNPTNSSAAGIILKSAFACISEVISCMVSVSFIGANKLPFLFDTSTFTVGASGSNLGTSNWSTFLAYALFTIALSTWYSKTLKGSIPRVVALTSVGVFSSLNAPLTAYGIPNLVSLDALYSGFAINAGAFNAPSNGAVFDVNRPNW